MDHRPARSTTQKKLDEHTTCAVHAGPSAYIGRVELQKLEEQATFAVPTGPLRESRMTSFANLENWTTSALANRISRLTLAERGKASGRFQTTKGPQVLSLGTRLRPLWRDQLHEEFESLPAANDCLLHFKPQQAQEAHNSVSRIALLLSAGFACACLRKELTRRTCKENLFRELDQKDLLRKRFQTTVADLLRELARRACIENLPKNLLCSHLSQLAGWLDEWMDG